MKLLLLTLALTLAATTTQAADQVTCESVSDAAYAVMFLRQNGEPMADTMAIAKDSKLLKMLVFKAYEKTAERSRSGKELAAGEFRDNWYLACVKTKI